MQEGNQGQVESGMKCKGKSEKLRKKHERWTLGRRVKARQGSKEGRKDERGTHGM